ncbi:zinc finger BED domain-containing protein 5-like [Myzus persicae]|uniref:zinc finger BED domain-containing protein 5-like n=1 Tax=Myzus persicae TaxID=13164 RepID=UPI000B938AA3|nr:zinc finger BED domain-containing protein 5-like [Myzus persicae]
MLGVESEKEIIKIPLSDSTISRRIINISEDIEEQVIEVIKSGELFALQVDESTDISGKAQLMAFIRFILCESMESDHYTLIIHTEVRWLSKGRVLSRFYELREELLVYFTMEQMECSDYLSDEFWCSKLGYLADIFEHLNQLNLSTQGENQNLLISTDKMAAFKGKLLIWKRSINDNNLDVSFNC